MSAESRLLEARLLADVLMALEIWRKVQGPVLVDTHGPIEGITQNLMRAFDALTASEGWRVPLDPELTILILDVSLGFQ